MAEKALTAVIQETYLEGIFTRSVDELVQAMGMSGISKSQVSRLCAQIDEKVKAFPDRPIESIRVSIGSEFGPRFLWTAAQPQSPDQPRHTETLCEDRERHDRESRHDDLLPLG
jgi:hypothetical protein